MLLVLVFFALNFSAYRGFFQDDELDTLSWAPSRPVSEFVQAMVKPTFDINNFRPTGHLFFFLTGKAFGMRFAPYITPIVAIHLTNVLLLYLLMRKLKIHRMSALAGAAFFALSAAAMDAYWKPMYVFDLLCATFSLASILLWILRRWVLSFVAFWLAYKAKELAVMLPAVLLAYEYWLGSWRFVPLIPFFVTSLSFGLQGMVLNPNKDNDYTFRFTLAALKATLPFYARRLFSIPFAGLGLLLLAFLRDRRVWFGLALMALVMFPLLFLPGRLFEAYVYFPLTGATLAMAAAASRVKPVWVCFFIALWLPWNYRQLRHEQRAILTADAEAAVFFNALQSWADAHPQVRTLVYNAAPGRYHDWGITAAWNIVHGTVGLPALFLGWPQTPKTLQEETVAYATWDSVTHTLTIQIHSPR